MALRSEIVDRAIFEADFGQWKPSAEEMKTFFSTAGLTPPTDADMKNFQTWGSNVPVNGYSTAWCGIFACYVLKHWGGLDVRWQRGGSSPGINGGGVKKVYDYRYVRPGDVGVVRGRKLQNGNYLWHHFIVTAIDYASNSLESVDGNSTGNKIVWHPDKKIRYSGPDDHTKSVCAYYRLPF
jgi:hypothetical protein